eukprot:2016048-Rhodomonas_salina.2
MGVQDGGGGQWSALALPRLPGPPRPLRPHSLPRHPILLLATHSLSHTHTFSRRAHAHTHTHGHTPSFKACDA